MNKTSVALAEIETVTISFYDEEVNAGGKLIGTISHDDDLTQPWVVLINDVIVYRDNTQKRCHSYIVWHYKKNTLPSPQQAVVVEEIKACEPHKEAKLEVQTQEVTTSKQPILQPPTEWDFTPPRFQSLPAAICPDCDGHGCGNCSYRGTRAEDLCTPVDGYRFTYVGRNDTQTAHNVYLDGEFLGILFKVRNADEVWENDTKTYYWQRSNGMKYWSVREAVEALRGATTPVELPLLSGELVAA